jgi:uncharacterized membrane protein
VSLINPLLLYGLGLASIPVILHFLLRAKPKKLMFPALRIIRIRRKTNVRRMRLRHIWLLLLRIAVIAAIVMALTRPSLPAANYSFTLREWISLAAILIVSLAVYWLLLRRWKQQRLPNHMLAYRRSILRGAAACVGLLVFLLLVAWPYQQRVTAEMTAPRPKVSENIPVAAVFLFDTSLSMDYQSEGKTRLQKAIEIATKHASDLPVGSRVGVAGTGRDTPVLLPPDRAGAVARMQELKTSPVRVSINQRIRTAIRVQQRNRERILNTANAAGNAAEADRFVREIYLFTDLARNAWELDTSDFLKKTLKEHDWLQVYLIDVGVKQAKNVMISEPSLSRQTLALNDELIIRANIGVQGAFKNRPTVEIRVLNSKGKLIPQGTATVSAKRGGERVTFPVRALTAPFTQGELRLVSSDPFEHDDVRYFTVHVTQPPKILIVGESRSETTHWMNALAPSELVRQGKARYACDYLPAAKFAPFLSEEGLAKYDGVCLINVAAPSDETWTKLATYVEDGGGLFITAGHARIDSIAYGRAVAQTVLPATLDGHVRFTEEAQRLAPKNVSHPVFARFAELGGFGELTSVDIRRIWRVTPAADAEVIARFSDYRTSPALLDRRHGKGRTLLLTTAVDMKGWSELPLARWSFVAFADQVMQHLGSRSNARFNYIAGETAFLPLDRQSPVSRYLLRKPGFQQLRGEVAEQAEAIAIDHLDQVGHYELVAADEQPEFRSAFSVNAAPQESDFAQLTTDDLDRLLGDGRYQITESTEGLERVVQRGRLGVEVFHLILGLTILAFCLEHFVANRFYGSEQQPDQPADQLAYASRSTV